MIFNEIYGCYYNAVAKIIELAVDGELTDAKMNEISRKYAFEESSLFIVPSLKNQDWQLITAENDTPIIYKPQMPLTELERRWLKTILSDQRVALFGVTPEELNEVEPLFDNEDIVYFDRYTDGDTYDDPDYIENFKLIINAIKNRQKLKIRYMSGQGRERKYLIEPIKLEYSDKEDKFRVLCSDKRGIRTLNLGRIIKCTETEEIFSEDIALEDRNKKLLVFELTNERRSLERAMLQFAHFKKEVERIGDKLYRVELEYDRDDETDVLIQIMSYGYHIKILAPDSIKKELASRLKHQMELWNW